MGALRLQLCERRSDRRFSHAGVLHKFTYDVLR